MPERVRWPSFVSSSVEGVWYKKRGCCGCTTSHRCSRSFPAVKCLVKPWFLASDYPHQTMFLNQGRNSTWTHPVPVCHSIVSDAACVVGRHCSSYFQISYGFRVYACSLTWMLYQKKCSEVQVASLCSSPIRGSISEVEIRGTKKGHNLVYWATSISEMKETFSTTLLAPSAAH